MQSADPETVSAAEFLFEIGELDGVGILRFFERPGRYPELLTLWDEEICRQGEAQDERRAIL